MAAWVGAILVLLALAGPLALVAGVVVAAMLLLGRPYTRMRVLRWRLWRLVPGLRGPRTPRALALALALYAVPVPLLASLEWVDVLTTPDPGALTWRILGRPGWPGSLLALPPYSPGALGPAPSPSPTLPVPPGYTLYGPAAEPSPGGSAALPSAGEGATPSPGGPVSHPLTISAAVPNCVAKGGPVEITVWTRAGSRVSIVVTYPDGTRTNGGTVSGTAGPDGRFVDTWTVDVLAPSGLARVDAMATAGAQHAATSGRFRIYAPPVESCG